MSDSSDQQKEIDQNGVGLHLLPGGEAVDGKTHSSRDAKSIASNQCDDMSNDLEVSPSNSHLDMEPIAITVQQNSENPYGVAVSDLQWRRSDSNESLEAHEIKNDRTLCEKLVAEAGISVSSPDGKWTLVNTEAHSMGIASPNTEQVMSGNIQCTPVGESWNKQEMSPALLLEMKDGFTIPPPSELAIQGRNRSSNQTLGESGPPSPKECPETICASVQFETFNHLKTDLKKME